MSAFAPRFFAGLKHLRHCTIHGDSQSVNVLANHFVRPARTPGILKVHFGLHFIESVVSKRRTLVLELLASSSSSLQSYFLTNHVIGHVDRRLREIRNHFSAADFSPECWTTSSESCVSVAPSAAKSELQQRFRASEKDRPQDYESKKSELQQRFRASEKDRSQDHESTNALPAISLAVAFTGASAGCTFCDANESEDSIKLQPPPRPVSFQDLLSVLGHWDWMLLLAAILLTLLHTVFSLAIPTTFSAVMNACREKLDLAVPIRTFVFLQGVVILLDGGKHFILGILGERIRQKLRVQLYASLLRQEIAYFDFNARGELFSLLGEDVHRIQQCLTDQILGFLTAVATLVYGGYKVVTISPKATVLVLLSFPILSIANLLAQGSCRKKAQEVIAASRSNLSMASEVLSNPRTVQAFGAESREAARYAESLQKQYSLECDYRAYTGLAHLAFSGINTLLSAAGLWYGGMLVAQGRTSLEDMMQFMQYSWKVGNAMGSLMTMYNEQHKSLAAATRVLRAMARRPRIARGEGSRPDGFKGLVELRDVTFAYPTRPETPVLRRMNLTLLPGTVTALVRPPRASAQWRAVGLCLFDMEIRDGDP